VKFRDLVKPSRCSIGVELDSFIPLLMRGLNSYRYLEIE
jgi:hypothetical protein